MLSSKVLIIILFVWMSLLAPILSSAHPMDLGTMKVQVLDSRLAVSLKLHGLAVSRFAKLEHPPFTPEELHVLEEAIFSATLGQAVPQLGGRICEWRKPEFSFAKGADSEFILIQVIAVCTQARMNPLSLSFPLPFLKQASPLFQLITRVESVGEPISRIASAAKPAVEIGAQDLKSFGGFLRIGMGHIGALPEEWQTREGGFRFPEGLDHIFFLLALVLAGGSITGLIKCISGFTLGHSITLALSTLKIVHIHGPWVEAGIALSIAYVAGISIFRPRTPHSWAVASLFGMVHGLGFASALQELELAPHELLPTLFGFNLGVELGQCVIVALSLPILLGIDRMSPKVGWRFRQLLATALFFVGSYWFVLRILD